MPRSHKKGGGVGTVEADYRDTGCNLAPKCLSCPLPRCQFDQVALPAHQTQIMRSASRAATIRKMYEERAMTRKEIAAELSVTERTVFRALEKKR